MHPLITKSPADHLRTRLGDLQASVEEIEPRRVLRRLISAYRRNELLVYAGAISFRAFAAIIPLLLFAIGLLGFLNLQEVWRNDIAPDIKPNVSPAAFQVIDDTVKNVLERRQLFWVTVGAALTVWEVSGAMRMIMRATNRIYGAKETRSLPAFFGVSIALGLVATLLILGAVSLVKFGPLLVEAVIGKGTLIGVVAFLIQWGLAASLLILLVGIVVRIAPAKRLPIQWVSLGALVVVVAWIVMSLLFGAYLTYVANYGSAFGNLATVFVTLEYVFLSSVVFVTGIQIDALAYEEAED